uniref:Uncharacterized protein n=1 Tax=Ignisphaera aggregans TaxID=334771 RepID=A0A7C4H2N0_9CREN
MEVILIVRISTLSWNELEFKSNNSTYSRSDYDTLIIADFESKYLYRIGKNLELIDSVRLNIEPHPYTLSEAIEMLKKGNPILVDTFEEGIVLYSREEFKNSLNYTENL